MAKKIGGLGKGLSAIFNENETEDSSEVITLKVSQIEPNRRQPRRSFDQEALEQLADSIREHGVLQPILVRPMLHGGYQIVAGERRYRAARIAELTEVPVVIRDLSDSETMQLALIENLQREDLSPIEEAEGYKTLSEEYGLSQEEIARTVGKSRSAVANAMRLLTLPDEVIALIGNGSLSAGHARTLLGLEDKSQILTAAKRVTDEKLSVRQTEALVKKLNSASGAKAPGTKKTPAKTPLLYRECELAMSQELGTKVTVVPGKKPGQGTLCVAFYDQSELYRLTAKLTEMWKRGSENS